ncbi:MAG TPA: glycosyltransferase family 39 protein [Candidatus Angelobacter sp.]|nr:glycosyltransferase family 39 protein [Candidatus Angelobacter sp.]
MNVAVESVEETTPAMKQGLLAATERTYWLVMVLAASAIFLGCMISPPALMDDVDAVHGQMARNMSDSGDWTIAHLDGVPYIEKAPLLYWLIGICYRILGVHDWAARIPVALAAILLCWLTGRYGRWAFGWREGFYAGLALATCVGLFLFTRIQIPDVMLTLCICAGFWSFQRTLEADEDRPKLWASVLAASLGVGILLKGLIAVVIPLGGMVVYLAVTRQLLSAFVWRRLSVFRGALILLAIAAPWHILATRRMPPYFDFTLHSGPGQYHGFFWAYFVNEHVLRFLNLRYPRDYNTVPRAAFWLLHLLWLFPWSVYFPAAIRLGYRSSDRAGRTRLLALCWAGFLLVFFTFSTTQEYYSMPLYPALALLLGCALAGESGWLKIGTRFLGILCAVCATVILAILLVVWNVPTPGDIASALQQHPEAYTLSLGHLGDLTIQSFAYLRTPLILAGIAFLCGAASAWLARPKRAILGFALMMILFLHASRLALVTFEPYLSSRPLAEALNRSPKGRLIVDGAYYSFSSVFFYSNTTALLLNGRINNLEYGSYAPGAPSVFIDDPQFTRLWSAPERYYVVTDSTQLARLNALVGADHLHQVAASGGKFLFTNRLFNDSLLSDSQVSDSQNSDNRVSNNQVSDNRAGAGPERSFTNGHL